MIDSYIFITMNLFGEGMTMGKKVSSRNTDYEIEMVIIIKNIIDRLNILLFQMKRIHDNIFHKYLS